MTIGKRIVFIGVLISGACRTHSSFECPDLRRVATQARVREFRDSSGVLRARGMAVDQGWPMGAVNEPWDDVTHYGEWRFFHPSGRVKAHIRYQIACYVHCCVAGPCPHVHDYPVGPFELWYPSGAQLAKGEFRAVRTPVESNCEGGDVTTAGRVAETSKFWDERGSPISLAEARARGLLPPSIEWQAFR